MKRGNKKKSLLSIDTINMGKKILNTLTDKLIEGIEEKFVTLQKRLSQILLSSLLVGLGLLALIFSFYSYLKESLTLSNSQILLYIGAIMLAIGFFLKYKLAKEVKK
ncbi:hypothetical protein ACFLZZ_01920 [Nanoarchaeota archaeon]